MVAADGTPVESWPARTTMHETALRIMDAAVDLFQERGFRQTSVRDITSACGLTQGALYIYFPSKEMLLAKIIEYGNSILEDRTRRTINEQTNRSQPQVLCAMVHSYVWYVTEHQKLARVANYFWNDLPEKEREIARSVRAHVTNRFERIIASGVADGSFKPLGCAETKLLVYGLITMMNGIMDWYRPGGRLDTRRISEHFQELALRLVGLGDQDGVISLVAS